MLGVLDMSIVTQIIGLVLAAVLLHSGAWAQEPPQKKAEPTTAAQGSLPSNLELLTDWEGIDFQPYVKDVFVAVRQHWYSVMPQSVQLGERGSNVVRFRVLRNGTVPPDSVQLEISSNKQDLDRTSSKAIQKAGPFKPLPEKFSKPFIELRFTFYYNCKPTKLPVR